MATNGSTDIRAALERLQQTLELLSDRYRQLRRERKQLIERLDELALERDDLEARSAARLETANREQERNAELEKALAAADTRLEAVTERIARLEQGISERDGLIADQEGALNRMEQELAEFRAGQEQEKQQKGAVEAERDELRELVKRLQGEQSGLREKQHQLIGKLDAATRDTALARSEVASLQEAARSQNDEEQRRWGEQMKELEEEVEVQRRAAQAAGEEREQARATVESLLERIRQLETGEHEERTANQERVHALTRDLAEALEMAAQKEGELTAAVGEVERLKVRLAELEKQLSTMKDTVDIGGVVIDPDERLRMVEQLTKAIELIDEHLGAQAD